VATKTAVQYAVQQEALKFEQPKCFFCDKPTWYYVEAPVGSDYAGRAICPECWHERIDPVMAAFNNLRMS